MTREFTDKMFETLKDNLGPELLAEELNRGMSTDEAYRCYSFLMRAYDININ